MLAKEDIQKEWEQGLLVAPLANIVETDDDFVMKLNMPGVNKDGVEVKLAEDELMIYGRTHREVPKTDKFLLKEIESGNYYRIFRVSESIDGSQIKAKMEDGVLTLTLPKHERVKPRDIPIETV